MQRWLGKCPLDLGQIGLLLTLSGLLAWGAGTPVLHVWDEARLAVNAAEMLQSGDWLVTRYGGQPDLWNTKPPLLIWLQAASLHCLGYNMWALRLPSVLAALATAGLLYRFGRYTLGSRFVGSLAALILASSPGFNGTHVARFGDYDSLLVLALTGTALSGYQYGQQRRPARLWRCCGWFALALLTKSAAALLVLPCLAAGLLVLPASRWVLWQGRTYGAVALAFVPLLAFYGLREAAAPGYLRAIWFNDWYGRLSQHIVTVSYPWWIYFQRLVFPGLLTWVLLLPVGMWRGMATAETAVAAPKQHFARFASVYVFLFLVIISVARTRLPWYSAPVYPLVALICALGLEHLTQLVRPCWPRPVAAGLLALATIVPAGTLLYHEWGRWKAEKADLQLHYGYQLPQLLAAHPQLRTFTILRGNEYDGPLLFYAAALQKQGVQPLIVRATVVSRQQLQPGQQLLICSAALQRSVQQHYNTRSLAAVAPCLFVEIMSRK